MTCDPELAHPALTWPIRSGPGNRPDLKLPERWIRSGAQNRNKKRKSGSPSRKIDPASSRVESAATPADSRPARTAPPPPARRPVVVFTGLRFTAEFSGLPTDTGRARRNRFRLHEHAGPVRRPRGSNWNGLLLLASGNAWNVALHAPALIYAAGGLCWMLIDPLARVVSNADRPRLPNLSSVSGRTAPETIASATISHMS